MFADFILSLRRAGVPASLTEYLALLGALRAGVASYSTEDFYYLARATLVKDERHMNRFDRVFGETFKGLETPPTPQARDLPEEWLRQLAEKILGPDEMAQIEALGGFDKLMQTLRERLAEQEGRHQGGSKWIGTAGTSPFGAYGTNPEGVRIGQATSRHRRAVKVWDKREFRDLDDTTELGTRTMKLALRRLRRFARQGALSELDLPGTIHATATQAGMLDLRLVPERRNTIKLLLFLDIGGSMDDHVRVCEELFSAARAEFKQLVHFYFHNCPYERLWKSNGRERSGEIATDDVLRTYGRDHVLVFVGDAAMSPYEITMPGGSIEHFNQEPGSTWMQRLTGHYRRCAWINPVAETHWAHTQSTVLIRHLIEQRMFPMTLQGLAEMTKELSKQPRVLSHTIRSCTTHRPIRP